MPEHAPGRDLDSDLRSLAHALVAEAPPAPARLPVGPHALPAAARERRWGRRYLPAVAAATVTLISLAGALVLGIQRDASTGADQRAGAQRLLLESWPGELMPDGSAVPLGIGELFPVSLTGAPQPLPGSRHVVVGEYYPSADPARHRAYHLVVVDADGRIELDRQIGTGSDWVSLLATTPDEAILIKARRDVEGPVGPGLDQPIGPAHIVAHDYATGEERTLADTNVGALYEDRADVVGNRLVLVHSFSNAPSCPLEVIDLASGAVSALGSLDGCSEVRGVRISPGGEFVAVTYLDLRLVIKVRLGIIDLASGLVLDDVLLGEPSICVDGPCRDVTRPVDYLGMAWDSDTTLRVALFDLERYPDGHRFGNPIPGDAIVQQTMSVG